MFCNFFKPLASRSKTFLSNFFLKKNFFFRNFIVVRPPEKKSPPKKKKKKIFFNRVLAEQHPFHLVRPSP
jgi:hypothetical protein